MKAGGLGLRGVWMDHKTANLKLCLLNRIYFSPQTLSKRLSLVSKPDSVWLKTPPKRLSDNFENTIVRWNVTECGKERAAKTQQQSGSGPERVTGDSTSKYCFIQDSEKGKSATVTTRTKRKSTTHQKTESEKVPITQNTT